MIAKLLLSIIIDLQFLVQSQVSRTYRFVNSVHTLIEGGERESYHAIKRLLEVLQ